MKDLEVLNDSSENQTILSKLSDSLTVRWNRMGIEIEEETKTHPTFSWIVAKEAKTTCSYLCFDVY